MLYYERYLEAVSYINARIREPIPETAIILGSGLSSVVEKMDDKKIIPFSEIPHFPVTTVKEHVGELVYGHINYAPVLVMNGRAHYYEGYDMEQITFPIRVFYKLGVKNVMLTNGAGGINLNYLPGDFMIINDHINLSGVSPLRGKNYDEFGPRFPDMTNVYDKKLINLMYDIAREIALPINEGVYAYLQGPSYETPAEIKMLRTLGADAVGMSTVPEAIIARHCGLRVLALSCITNMAAGISNYELSHEEVKENAEKVREQFVMIIQKLAASLYIKKGNHMLELGE